MCILETKHLQRAGMRMHGRIDHVQNQHARWHNSENINGSGQYTYGITYGFLSEKLVLAS